MGKKGAIRQFIKISKKKHNIQKKVCWYSSYFIELESILSCHQSTSLQSNMRCAHAHCWSVPIALLDDKQPCCFGECFIAGI